MMFRRAAAIVLAICCAAACSTPPARQQTESRERAMLAPLKTKYPTVIMGFDFRGASTLDVSIDMNGLIDQDEDTEAAMRTDAIHAWKKIWTATHSGHAALLVRFVDFRGNTQFTESSRV